MHLRPSRNRLQSGVARRHEHRRGRRSRPLPWPPVRQHRAGPQLKTAPYTTTVSLPTRTAEVILSEAGIGTIRATIPATGAMLKQLGTACTRIKLYAWYTWEHNTGYYWHAYNSAGASDSNMWGIFQGMPRVTRAAGPRVGMYGKPAAGTPTEHGIYSCTACRITQPGYLHRKNTFGIFLGVKGADVPADFDAYDNVYDVR